MFVCEVCTLNLCVCGYKVTIIAILSLKRQGKSLEIGFGTHPSLLKTWSLGKSIQLQKMDS